ncbi:MAG TPA: nucleoside deaminase [Thermoanaerobaculia bacterium]
MRRAIELSARALSEEGTEPFGAVIVKDGRIVGEGLNHSLAHFDPTSHGEVEAIRDACSRLRCVELSGCELYTSCEPCALCAATISIVGIARMYYAATMSQVGRAFAQLTPAERHPIDTERLRSEAGALVENRKMPAEKRLDGEAAAILETWAAQRKADSRERHDRDAAKGQKA